jgi:isoleucyl-tRNA synthetase
VSKSKKNFPDPMLVVNKYGADALRLYLINSPVVRAESLRFKEEGVFDVVKKIFLPWFNAYRFFIQNSNIYHDKYGSLFDSKESKLIKKENIMDIWITSGSFINKIKYHKA